MDSADRSGDCPATMKKIHSSGLGLRVGNEDWKIKWRLGPYMVVPLNWVM